VIAAAGDHHSQRMANQLGGQTRHPVSLILRPAVFDHSVLAVDVTGLLEALEERREEGRITLRRRAVEKPDHRHRGLLRVRGERPNCRCPAEHGDEIASPHVPAPSWGDVRCMTVLPPPRAEVRFAI
jgi:hypothetical protein